MREIKFRAWDEGNKRFWDSCVWGGSDWSLCEDRPTGFPISQYTGLKDKNGKEIYEGDIINGCCFNTSYCLGKVVWWTGGWGVEPIPKGEEGIADLYNNHTHSEVIGNIYENAELMKE